MLPRSPRDWARMLGDFGRPERTKIASGSASGALERARIVSGRPSRRLERAKIDSGGPSGRLERPNIALGRRFCSIWGVRRVDFGNFSTLFRSSGPSRSKKRRRMKKPVKNKGFYRFFSCPLLRARFENQQKIDPKTLRKGVSRQILCETRFFSNWRAKDGS